ncbi:MAG: hypothetical protein M3308_09615, partial [Actinomycetota bacterium]|nr:hypothetical protein [Actinomycetota bacterium]
YFPLTNPGIVTVPLSFLLGFVGSFLGRERSDRRKFAEMEVRALTGTSTATGSPVGEMPELRVALDRSPAR